MSTSTLYHAFGLKGIRYKATRYEGEYLIFEAEMVTKEIACPNCGTTSIIFKGSKRLSPGNIPHSPDKNHDQTTDHKF